MPERRRPPLDDPRLGQPFPHHLEGKQDGVVVERVRQRGRDARRGPERDHARAGEAAGPPGVVAERPPDELTGRAQGDEQRARQEPGVQVRPHGGQDREPPQAVPAPGLVVGEDAREDGQDEIGDQLRARRPETVCRQGAEAQEPDGPSPPHTFLPEEAVENPEGRRGRHPLEEDDARRAGEGVEPVDEELEAPRMVEPLRAPRSRRERVRVRKLRVSTM